RRPSRFGPGVRECVFFLFGRSGGPDVAAFLRIVSRGSPGQGRGVEAATAGNGGVRPRRGANQGKGLMAISARRTGGSRTEAMSRPGWRFARHWEIKAGEWAGARGGISRNTVRRRSQGIGRHSNGMPVRVRRGDL